MADFSFNEDGTLSYHKGHVPYDTTKHEYGALVVAAPKGNGKHRKKATKPHVDYRHAEDVATLVEMLQLSGTSISQKTINKYLVRIHPSYQAYFKSKVEEINQRYK